MIENTRLIPLTQGKHAIVDDSDFEWLSRWKWHASKDHNGTFRARRTERSGNGKRLAILLHRVIIDASEAEHVDHINHDPLDNRRANLRVCTIGENNRNTTSRQNSTSQYIGVSWHKRDRIWRAQIRANDKVLHLGTFTCEVAAARAYDDAARIHHGAFANPNFEQMP